MITSKRAHLYVAAITHPGMKGKNNEDRYAVSAYSLDAKGTLPSVLAIVADGIGGHKAGEVAAEIAVSTISRMVAESDGSRPEVTLRDAVVLASEEIQSKSTQDAAQRGMGSTAICAWVIADRLYMASVGDTRLYLIRSGTIRRLNIDHTWVQEAIDHGALTPEQARGHPNAHVIRRYLGSPQQVVPDLRLKLNPSETDDESEANQGLRLLPEDILLLCSDGLHDLVDDPEILEVMSSKKMEQGLEQLVNMANERGGHDNITMVSLQLPGIGAAQVFPAPETALSDASLEETAPMEVTQVFRRLQPEVPAAAPRSRRLVPLTCVVLVALLILGLGAAAVFGYVAGLPTATPTVTQTLTATVTSTRAPTATSPRILNTPPSRVTPSTPAPFIPLPSGQPTLTPWPTNTVASP